MRTSDPRARPLPKHPARRLVLLWVLAGLLFLGATPHFLMGSVAAVGGLTFVCGLFLLQQGLLVWRRLPGVQHVNLAAQHLSRGAFADVRAELAQVPAATRRDTMLGRACLLQEALMALYEGHLLLAEDLATRALAMRRSVFAREYELQYDASALAARALARVARGDLAGAKADADAAEGSRHAAPEVIARARLVKAVLISRAAYHEEALRKFLVENAQLVLEHGMPRERMLFRALRRMSRSPARSVYREPAHQNDDRAPSKTQSWIAAIAPEAASFTSGDRMLADTVEEAPLESGVPSDMNALQRARRHASVAPQPRRFRRVAALWAVLVVMFLAIWQFLTPPMTAQQERVVHPPPVVETSLATSLGTAALAGLGFVAFMAFVIWRSRRFSRAYLEARRHVTLGDLEKGTSALLKLAAETKTPQASATARLQLARMASAAGDFAGAITHADAGIALVSRGQQRILAVDLLLPSLMMESAVAMAARGGADEAAAEIALLERDFPTFSQLALAQLRARLMIAVRTGDRARARQLAKGRTAEMRIPYREDMLADLVLASHGDLDEQDLQRVDAELGDDAALRGWLDRVAPGLRSERPLATRARVAEAAEAELIEVEEPDADAPVALRMR